MLWLRRYLVRGRSREQEEDKAGAAHSLSSLSSPLLTSHKCFQLQHQFFKVLSGLSPARLSSAPQVPLQAMTLPVASSQ